METQKYKHFKPVRLTKNVIKNGYCYSLVEVTEEERKLVDSVTKEVCIFPLPSWDGNKGFALKSFKKITN